MSGFDPEIFSHEYWFESAEKLKFSAEVLLDKYSTLGRPSSWPNDISEREKQKLAVFQSHMMLLGFSLENLIKAVSAKAYTKNHRTIKDFKDLRENVWKVKDAHDILAIADNCGFIITDDERDLIARHSEYFVWAGRYHIAKDKAKYEEVKSSKKLRRKKGDEKLIEDLFAKAQRFLES